MERITRRSEWTGFIKNKDGEIEYTRPLEAVTYEPEIDLEKALIRQAPPVKITPTKATRKSRKDTLIQDLPDIQYGWRKLPDGSLVPLHDQRAMDVALQISKELQPNHIVLGGDDLDFAELSRFDPDSRHFENTMQLALDGLFLFYAQLRAENPNARIHALEGNHNRLTKFVLKNALKLHGIKRAGDIDEYPILTYPFLMRFNELEIEWYSGYPANSVFIENTQYVHGKQVRSNGSSAFLYSKENDLNTVFHHIHRHESHTRTNTLGRYITAISFGCLADTGGAVPSYHNGVDDKGNVIGYYENWQNGTGLIHEYGEYTQFQPIIIKDGSAQLDGKEYLGEEKW